MKRRTKFFAFVVFVLGGVLPFVPELYAARSRSSTMKKVSGSSKKKTVTSSGNVVSSGSSSERANSSGSRATTSSSRGTSSTSSTSSAVDEATEISNLTANLLSCLVSPCKGTVDYEGCFKTSNIDIYLSSTQECQDYLDDASSDTVRVLAKSNVTSKIKGYLTEYCEAAGGYLDGTTCKFDVYYYAKSPDGAHSVKKSKTYSMGNTVTCDPTYFGLSQTDLEYKEEMTTEQKMQLITAGIEAGTGAINLAVKGIGMINAKNELRQKNRIIGDIWYKFDGKDLVEDCKVREYNYCENDDGCSKSEIKRLKAEAPNWTEGTDENGAVYLRGDENAQCKKDKYPTESPKTQLCSDVDSLSDDKVCYVYIEKATELSRMEKLSSLIRSVGGLDEKAVWAADAQKIKSRYLTLSDAESMQSLATTVSGGGQYCSVSKCTADNISSVEVCFVSGDNLYTPDSAKQKLKQEIPLAIIVECRKSDNVYHCLTSEGKEEKCSWNGQYYMKSGTSSGIADEYGKNAFDVLDKQAQGAKNTEGSVLGRANNYISAYNKVRSQYDSNQDELNKHKKELEELEAKSGAGVQSIISEGVSTIGKSAITLVTTSMEASNNKGIMTGNCYLGDPANGNLFMVGGESKKLTWKLFN